jgi:NAD dependent epimerase/dehydratase family enzyme
VHLAGENIAGKRWSQQRKEAIITSREQSAQLIYGVQKNKVKLEEAFISASGVGIYGAVSGQPFAPRIKRKMIFSLTCQNGRQLLTNFKEMVFVLLRLELV